uniref:Uncharacterized protein n=1 Tax=Romanomermis culicivorax TaxID=13658 RepID=A0A915ISR2_ROMCU
MYLFDNFALFIPQNVVGWHGRSGGYRRKFRCRHIFVDVRKIRQRFLTIEKIRTATITIFVVLQRRRRIFFERRRLTTFNVVHFNAAVGENVIVVLSTAPSVVDVDDDEKLWSTAAAEKSCVNFCLICGDSRILKRKNGGFQNLSKILDDFTLGKMILKVRQILYLPPLTVTRRDRGGRSVVVNNFRDDVAVVGALTLFHFRLET